MRPRILLDTMDTKRDTVPALEELLGSEIKVLDHGFIRVVDYLGSDESIVDAARVSYGRGTRRVSENRALIRYLLRHRHTTPFEMCEIKLHVKLPIFVARQWIRHRTANVNEYSARYSILDREFYVPEIASEQSRVNNQGRGEALPDDEAKEDLKLITLASDEAYGRYLYLLNRDDGGNRVSENRVGMARELGRMVLPTNFYTQWYWKIDLHNLFHFLSLRADSHAQFEIREYANRIAEIVDRWVPMAAEAFGDYVTGGIRFSRQEIEIVRNVISANRASLSPSDLGPREWQEFVKKLGLQPDDSGG